MQSSTTPTAGSNNPSVSELPQGNSVATVTQTQTVTGTQTEGERVEVLQLTLRAPPSVRWDENTVDNEGMGRKSSKRCCIFHKQRAFGESSTDSSDVDSDSGEEDDGNSGDAAGPRKHRKIARPKKADKVPDFQRFHA